MFETSVLFRGLPAPLLDKLAALCVRRRIEAEEVLFRKGDPGEALFGVVTGRLRIHASAADGRDALLNIMQAGDVFGEIALLDGLVRTADATALETTELAVLRRADFLRLMSQESELALHLLQLTCRRLRWLSEMVEDATFLPVPARLAKRLLHLAKMHGRPDGAGVRIDLRLSQQAIGDLAGVSRETTNKHLRTWSDRGWIVLRRQTVVLHDLELLEELAGSNGGDFI